MAAPPGTIGKERCLSELRFFAAVCVIMPKFPMVSLCRETYDVVEPLGVVLTGTPRKRGVLARPEPRTNATEEIRRIAELFRLDGINMM